MLNMEATARTLSLPGGPARSGRRIADTTLIAPDDFAPAGVPVHGDVYRLGAHGVAIFEQD
jgi:hypothetical protein